ncbi:MFS transporter [Streptomyces sp. NPDC059679]|uniref:MFS transporter n=1 Tax=Streptomyces sp. NPDC059679 TaxID=3346903 RepID=UPI0036CF2B22
MLVLGLLRGRRGTAEEGSDGGTGPNLVVPAVLTAALAASMAQTIVISALPAFGRSLHVSGAATAWLLTAFMLASAVTTPIAGRLGDLFGHRRVLLACLGSFTVGTLLCALGAEAGSLPLLLAGRAVSGISGGVFPLAFGIVRTAVEPPRARGVIAVLSAMFGVGGSAGMVLAGPLADAFGTAWLFWPLLALAGAALTLARRLPAGPVAPGGRVDLAGAALLGSALVCLLLGIGQGAAWGWGSARVVGLLLGAAVALAAFAAVELRVGAPLVDLRVLRRRPAAATNVVTFVVGAAMFGVITLVPRFVQTPPPAGYGFGASAGEAGLALVPVAVVMLAVSPLTTRLRDRFGVRAPLRLGVACGVLSFALLAVAHAHMWQFHAAGVLIGAGYGLSFAALGNLVVDTAGPADIGVAGGVNTIARTVGGGRGRPDRGRGPRRRGPRQGRHGPRFSRRIRLHQRFRRLRAGGLRRARRLMGHPGEETPRLIGWTPGQAAHTDGLGFRPWLRSGFPLTSSPPTVASARAPPRYAPRR